MQFFRVQRACTRRQQSFCGVVCGSNGRTGDDGADSTVAARGPSGTIEFCQWKTTVEGLTGSANRASPLQFILDDFTSPSRQTACAFRRAVCVPFQPAVSSIRAALERQVRILLLDSCARSRCCDVYAAHSLLTQHGLQCSIMHPGKSHAHVPLFASSIGAPFLVVTSGDTDELVVVDGALREHLLVAPCTPAYQRTLTANIPDLFIGTLARLQQLVTYMASAISLNFASQGVDTPPWRRTAALLSRWAVVKEHQAAELVFAPLPPLPPLPQVRAVENHVELPLPSQELQQRQSPAAGGPSSAADDAESPPETVQAAGPEGQVDGDGEAVRQRPFIVVRGFEVGGSGAPARVARQRGVWPSVKPGGLASLCRKQSGGTPGSSTGSEGVLGASPASVFRGD
ncbi:hypothetical protein PLESTB_000521000 [Pleodorina starrii]|uniref:Uncharacterized protein n=1 Tax=Pleodorina starrii TaxID=330485 RepID=A0A9W6BGZ3_9CHLO|nr:hypothetical protein PLESTM_000384400 [Pleodorina starrii]GLC51610.1 hypothetical protein PLESTB_000521000 [Pleodorina starrii]GLC72379.1 hypothetical protein PLESTF_001241300 [Pleodorina starrii]